METKITGISLWQKIAVVDGCEILASFDVQVRGFELRGCSLVIDHEGQRIVWAPKPDTRGATIHKVRFLDPDLRNELTVLAVNAFEALGGHLPEGASL